MPERSCGEDGPDETRDERESRASDGEGRGCGFGPSKMKPSGVGGRGTRAVWPMGKRRAALVPVGGDGWRLSKRSVAVARARDVRELGRDDVVLMLSLES
jgi:hypothetical protein